MRQSNFNILFLIQQRETRAARGAQLAEVTRAGGGESFVCRVPGVFLRNNAHDALHAIHVRRTCECAVSSTAVYAGLPVVIIRRLRSGAAGVTSENANFRQLRRRLRLPHRRGHNRRNG